MLQRQPSWHSSIEPDAGAGAVHTITVIRGRNKRDEIARTIDDYESRLAQAKADLAHIDAAIAIFASGGGKTVRPYVDVHRLFKRGELAAISREALRTVPAILANWR